MNSYIDAGSRRRSEACLSTAGIPKVDGFEDGYWVGPTVFENVTPDMSIGSEEIFGPVAGINQVRTRVEEAIAMMHTNRYGNACSLFTNEWPRAAREFRYQAGISMIGINIGVAAPMAFFPFGGSKQSFFGDLKAAGRDGISFFTDQRVVISRWSAAFPADPAQPPEDVLGRPAHPHPKPNGR